MFEDNSGLQKWKNKQHGYIVFFVEEYSNTVFYKIGKDTVDSPSNIFYRQFIKVY